MRGGITAESAKSAGNVREGVNAKVAKDAKEVTTVSFVQALATFVKNESVSRRNPSNSLAFFATFALEIPCGEFLRVLCALCGKPLFENQPARSAWFIGSVLTLFPVAAKIALTTAGAIGGVPGSPTPPGASWLGTTCTSTFGISLMRSIL